MHTSLMIYQPSLKFALLCQGPKKGGHNKSALGKKKKKTKKNRRNTGAFKGVGNIYVTFL